MATRDRASAIAMTNHAGPEFRKGQNQALERLKSYMGNDSHRLNALKFDRALISSHQDDSLLDKHTPVSPHRIEVGTANGYGRTVTIYAYLVRNHGCLWNMKVVCYAFPPPSQRGVQFHISNMFTGGGTLHQSLSHLHTAAFLNAMLKLYFIDEGFKLDWVDFSKIFTRRVNDLCVFSARRNAISAVHPGPTRSTSSRRHVLMGTATDRPAKEHEESPGPSTTVLKRERHSTPPISRDDSIATLSDPNTTIHPSPRNQPKNPTRPLPIPPTPPKPIIDGTSLTTNFTLPLTTARATEKSLDKKILTKKRKLAENGDEIERLWALIEVADKKKLKLEGKIKSYEGRREDAQKTQRELVEGLDPMLRRFIRVAREVGVGEEDEEMEEGGE